jgi:diaminohydroxyphosphoribosylaminopyrimidine deaminase/5-amino-6-(5-phosphoribosylamino)uracil reductase
MGRRATLEEKAAFSTLDTEIIEFTADDGIINLKELLKLLGERQVTSVLVEGGGILVGSLFDQGLVDRVFVFVAPIIIGGEGRAAVVGRGADKLADAFRLEKISVTRFGEDTLISGYVAGKSG